ncbi:hypothetical protein E4S40_07295 [Algoriphagus kandeliae]|uniref:Uncharacterized protein n=1 Tax=Algoriphagus kandeliae TaxID=2562278 RepID=A0A4Y9QTV0_9BACT|nr:hypothetical protein [Algoriphagus kandeliae]TFV96024.1 hypothetical protein E4S40_07295 [Algoriphagus kandeliae]
MKKIFKIQAIFLLLFALLPFSTEAQKGKKASTSDSSYFEKPYPYILPILGDKAHNAKVRLPFPMGIMVNNLVGTQFLSLTDLSLGFGRFSDPNPPNMIDLSEVVEFEDIKAQTSTHNIRIDTWVLPFLNVYGIVGQTKKADINVNLTKPIPLDVSTEVSGTYVGYGLMAAGAVGRLFASLDMNQTFNYNPRLEEPAKVTIFGIRTGPVFKFKNRPQSNVTFWAGAMLTSFNSETTGNIPSLELAPNAPERIQELQGNLDNWYEDLSPADKLKYALIYNRLGEGLDNLGESIQDSYISYSFNKGIENPWNMLIGAQWQLNYRWQIRTEAQFLGDRTAGLFSLNYRFGIKGKNWFSN